MGLIIKHVLLHMNHLSIRYTVYYYQINRHITDSLSNSDTSNIQTNISHTNLTHYQNNILPTNKTYKNPKQNITNIATYISHIYTHSNSSHHYRSNILQSKNIAYSLHRILYSWLRYCQANMMAYMRLLFILCIDCCHPMDKINISIWNLGNKLVCILGIVIMGGYWYLTEWFVCIYGSLQDMAGMKYS